MKKLTKKQSLTLRTETIKALTDDKLTVVAGGRWYESWSVCGGGTPTGDCQAGTVSSGVRG